MCFMCVIIQPPHPRHSGDSEALSPEEAETQHARLRHLVMEADTDKDGTLDIDEFRAAFTAVLKEEANKMDSAKEAALVAMTSARLRGAATYDYFDGCCNFCDLSGKLGFDVRYIDEDRAGMSPADTAKDIFRTDDTNYILVEKRKSGTGGFVSCIFASLFIFIAASVWMLMVRTPSPMLPYNITNDFFHDSLLQRQVSTVPLADVSGHSPTLVSQWPLQHDNLYVTEVLAGDWGTTCLALSDGMLDKDTGEVDMATVVQTIFASSAGILPDPYCVGGMPCTTVDDLREAQSLRLETEGCTLLGSKQPCSAAYNLDSLYDSINNPVMGYGCYIDVQGVYHHLTLFTLALHTAIVQGDNPTYLPSWSPSERFPLFGTGPAGIKQHVIPPSYDAVGIRESKEETATLYSFEPERQTSLYVLCGWMAPLGYETHCPVDDASLEQCFKQHSYRKQDSGLFDYTYSQQSSLFQTTASATTQMQTGGGQDDPVHWAHSPGTGLVAAWDAERGASVAVGPSPTAMGDDSFYSCQLHCDSEKECFYEGQVCPFFSNGQHPDANHKDTKTAQPTGVLCPQGQSFHIESTLGVVRACADGWDSAWCDRHRHVATSYNTLSDPEGSVCMEGTEVTADNPLSISISRSFSPSAVQVEILLPKPLSMGMTLVKLVIAVLGLHLLGVAAIGDMEKKNNKRRVKYVNHCEKELINANYEKHLLKVAKKNAREALKTERRERHPEAEGERAPLLGGQSSEEEGMDTDTVTSV
ncbi:hypothetical protein KIPB_007690 [Kipferlia bialata]|uniref:EF-hand domain-containing protein n=1 Tax=Kipferlia bialata TaxID=797122 RepID=A0A9K3GJA4_9EUKA|nr:hypothetical protein KIPB_007690 [Kipferlia bialata]|eukprot:g7690.t1